MEKVLDELAKFRKRTGAEIGCLEANITDELKEVMIEVYKDDPLGAVAEFTDVIVFCVNGIAMMNGRTSIRFGMGDVVEPSQAIQLSLCYLADFSATKSIGFLQDIIDVCCDCIESMGFDAEKAMMETCKKINSRDGAYDEAVGKWCKFTDEASKSKWYTPDYSKAEVRKWV